MPRRSEGAARRGRLEGVSQHDSEFGPRGYLPERAARRARKIVLREQMGVGWPLAALLAAVLVAGAGVVFLRTSNRPPGPPFASVATLEQLAAGSATVATTDAGPVLVVRGGGRVRAFAAPDRAASSGGASGAATWCPATDRIEASDGRVWSPDGRLVGGRGASLQPLRSVVFDAVVYVDPTTPLPAPVPDPRGERPACAS